MNTFKRINRANVTSVIIREKLTSRGGGGVEISLDKFGFKGEKMAAYQNYLGGGLLGAICVNDTIRSQSQRPFMDDESEAKLDQIREELKRYFHEQTNPDTEWESMSYEQNQSLPVSAY